MCRRIRLCSSLGVVRSSKVASMRLTIVTLHYRASMYEDGGGGGGVGEGGEEEEDEEEKEVEVETKSMPRCLKNHVSNKANRQPLWITKSRSL